MKVSQSQELGHWTDSHGVSYFFLCTLEDVSDAQVISVQLMRETAPQLKAEIGYLRGILLPRPSARNLFDAADDIGDELFGGAGDISEELLALSIYFCESDGKATRCQHPKLQEQSPMAVSGGGIFHVFKMEIKPEYQGNDFGLGLIHEAMYFLGHKWTLAVMVPYPLTVHGLRYDNHPRRYYLNEDEAVETAKKKLGVYYARMGFVQASASREGYKYYFLTRELYYELNKGVRLTHASADEAKQRWISKENSSQIVWLSPTLINKPTGLDLELNYEILKSFQNNDLSIVEKLIQKGASIDGAYGIHAALEGTNPNSPDANRVLQRLIELGGDVNHKRWDGTYPVHLAAKSFNARDIKVLITAGADRSKTSDWRTPIDTVRSISYDIGDFPNLRRLIYTCVREINVIPPYETIKALMTNEEKAKLIDGWMTPRLYSQMKQNASDAIHDAKDVEFGYSNHWYFIPPHVLENYPNGRYYRCGEAFSLVFDRIHVLLEDRRAPTKDRIESDLIGRRMYDNFVSNGFKVEYALDYLLHYAQHDPIEDGEFYDEQPGEFSHLDGMFEFARFMLGNKEGSIWNQRGPYAETVTLLNEDLPMCGMQAACM
eukprot:scaffold54095_cov51-Cyclotella_meneghiniana.AAC.5